MKPSVEEGILPFKVQQLVEIVMQKKSLAFSDALYYLYSSSLYKHLMDSESKIWYLSGLRLYELLEKEKQSGKKWLTDNPKEALFVIFCIENYSKTYHKTAEETLVIFSEKGIFDFLKNGFDVLHTQSKEYIVSSIADFLETHKTEDK